jgi:hypothetical protein
VSIAKHGLIGDLHVALAVPTGRSIGTDARASTRRASSRAIFDADHGGLFRKTDERTARGARVQGCLAGPFLGRIELNAYAAGR